jgi:hypothetical protein
MTPAGGRRSHALGPRPQCPDDCARSASRRSAIADRSNARTEQGGGAPGAILILLDYVGDVHDLNYTYSIARRESSTHEHRKVDCCSGVKCLPFRRPRAGFVLRDADGAPHLITNKHAVTGENSL